MKLVRYGQPGAERPGVLDAQGVLRDLSMLLPELGPAQLAPRTLSALAALDASRLPAVQGAPRGRLWQLGFDLLNVGARSRLRDGLEDRFMGGG